VRVLFRRMVMARSHMLLDCVPGPVVENRCWRPSRWEEGGASHRVARVDERVGRSCRRRRLCFVARLDIRSGALLVLGAFAVVVVVACVCFHTPNASAGPDACFGCGNAFAMLSSRCRQHLRTVFSAVQPGRSSRAAADHRRTARDSEKARCCWPPGGHG
jgi:hypothetical protein